MIEITKTQPGIVWVTHPPDYCAALSVAELAALLDVTENTVNRWCRGDAIPRTAQLAMESAVIGLIHCEGWQGAHFSLDRDGVGRFYLANRKRGFTCGQIEAWEHIFNHRDALARQVSALEIELALAESGRVTPPPACRFSPRRAGKRTMPRPRPRYPESA